MKPVFIVLIVVAVCVVLAGLLLVGAGLVVFLTFSGGRAVPVPEPGFPGVPGFPYEGRDAPVVTIRPDLEREVGGPLALGARSRALQALRMWRRPLDPSSREERENGVAGILVVGDEFTVLDHHERDGILWVRARAEGDGKTGWIRSAPDEPVRAVRLED